MSDAPDRIWAWHFIAEKQDDIMKGGWNDEPDRKETPYIRADLHQAEVERSKALEVRLTTARTDALKEASELADKLAVEMEAYMAIPTTTTKSKALCIRNRILALAAYKETAK